MHSTVRAGDELRLTEQDYKYGTGALRMIVTQVVSRVREADGSEWLRLRGFEVLWNGAMGERLAPLVRMSALPKAVIRRHQMLPESA